MTTTLGTEQLAYALVFGIGLLISVYAMINGSIKPVHDPSLIKTPPAALNLFVLGAAVTAAGIIGYLFAQYSQFATIGVLGVSIVAGIVAWIGVSVLMANWAFKGPLNDPHEDMEELQGTVAIVTQDITEDQLGEISYIFRGETLTAPARCLSGVAVERGTEVIIDIVENGVADIEVWAVVEERINGVAH